MKLTDYETAKALKELGFDEPCYQFTGDGFEDEARGGGIGAKGEYYNSNLPSWVYACPYLPQAAEFLREQYGVHMYVVPCFGNDEKEDFSKWQFGLCANGWSPFFEHPHNRNPFPDHDTALQEGIKKGIEVVKEEQCTTE